MSANTTIHIVAVPKMASTKNTAFTSKACEMFCESTVCPPSAWVGSRLAA